MKNNHNNTKDKQSGKFCRGTHLLMAVLSIPCRWVGVALVKPHSKVVYSSPIHEFYVIIRPEPEAHVTRSLYPLKHENH